MSLIPQEIIDDAAITYPGIYPYANDYDSFKAGAEFAETYLKEFISEFTTYLGIESNGIELFEEFLKERDETNTKRNS